MEIVRLKKDELEVTEKKIGQRTFYHPAPTTFLTNPPLHTTWGNSKVYEINDYLSYNKV